MTPEQFATLDAVSLSSWLRSGRCSALELTHAAIDRIEQTNGVLNAVVTKAYDAAIAAAKKADDAAGSGQWLGPLHGIPILIKDLFDFRQGIRNTFGCRATKEFVPDTTMTHIARLEEAGAVIVGKTNTPEFGHKGITDNLLFGPTATPFDHSRNAGGSSGGSAAAVAAGMVPLAQGSDAGGSIRIPAAWCGVLGVKLSFGRVPNTGSVNAFGSGAPFVHAGPLARTVRDAALMAQIMAGPHSGDPLSVPVADMNLAKSIDVGVAGARIAYSPDWGCYPVDPDVHEVVGQAVAAFEPAGAQVDRVGFAFSLSHDEIAQLWLRQVGLIYLEMFTAFADAGMDLLKNSPYDIPAEIHQIVERATTMTALDARRDQWRRTTLYHELEGLLADYDFVVTPTLSTTPVVNEKDGRTLGPHQVRGVPVERTIGWCLTHPVNFTGHPAASVPAGITPRGLPVGMQIIARRWNDNGLIAACAAFERQRPWIPTLERVCSTLVDAG